MDKPHEKTHAPKNEGEGSQTGAREYDRGAKEFVDSGRVESAAEDARRAVEGEEREDLEAAEQAGKARAKEEDRALSEEMPSWWDEDFDSTWENVKTALHRDWVQTRRNIWRNSGADLSQSVVETLRQAANSEQGSSEGQPSSFDLSYEQAEPALRFGHGAAIHFGDPDWTRELEARLRDEWNELERDIEWERARVYVRHGFYLGRESLH